jgi:hypothetical protein
MKWRSIKDTPPNERLLTFSPVYPVGDVMRFRIMDSQFLKLCKEVTYWCPLEENKPEREPTEEEVLEWRGKMGHFMD